MPRTSFNWNPHCRIVALVSSDLARVWGANAAAILTVLTLHQLKLQSCVELPTRQADLSAEPGPAEPVWRVSWSLTGNLLAVSSGESNVTLYKEQLDSQRSAVAGRDATHDTPAISSWKIVGEVGGP